MITVVSAYWLALVGLIVLPTGIAVGLLWTSRPTRGEHAHYDRAFSVSAVAARVARGTRERGARC